MKFGLLFGNLGAGGTPEGGATIARAAEDAGFESIWTAEHPVVPVGYVSAYPYSADGRMQAPDDYPLPDPLIWLTWVAAATTRIRLGTGILILPLRNPVVLAKELATLDLLSGGRMTLGIGTGWLREEFEALGVPWERRGARTDDYVGALRALWRDGASSFASDHVSFDNVMSYPKPPQGPGLPVVVGGSSEAAARRAGRIGDDFFPGVDPVRLAELVAVMRAAALDAGRDPDAIGITTGGAGDPDELARLAELGVTRFVVPSDGRSLTKALRHINAVGEIIARAG